VALSFTDPRAQQRYTGWRGAADAMGAGLNLTPEERQALDYMAGGGIHWAEENEPDKHPGWSGADLSGYAANTLNPAQALSYLMRLRRSGRTWGQQLAQPGGPFQWSGRADVGGNARNLSSVTPAGTGAPEDATNYIADWNAGGWGTGTPGGTVPGQATQGARTLYEHLNMALNPMQETFWQTNPQLLWGQVGHGFAPNWEAPRGDWWRQRYTQAQNDYANASATGTDPNLSFVSWLNSQYPQISQEFGLLPAAARGENAPFLPAGRPQL
jgi:hypothetical protein